jgi:hypothetical protein
MERKLADSSKQALYRKRQATLEPVVGNAKVNRGSDDSLGAVSL